MVEPDTLILGEPGTGRGAMALELHQRSPRRARPFVAADCGVLPDELLESELFGNEEGAFPGAITAREGRVALAEGGTLFLDRIGEMNLPAQARLLRLLQDRCYERAGSDAARTADVRVLAATDRDLAEAVARGAFREDLWRRLQAAQIRIPPLRERLDRLPAHAVDLPDRFGGSPDLAPAVVAAAEVLSEGFDLKAHMERIEVELIRLALQRTGGVVAHAARRLGLRRTTLVEKLRKYGLDRSGLGGAATGGC